MTTQPRSPREYLQFLAQQLDAMRRRAQECGCYPRLEEGFGELEASLARIDPDAPDAMDRMRRWFFGGLDPLHRRIRPDRCAAGGGACGDPGEPVRDEEEAGHPGDAGDPQDV